jgi:hypothetical protein
MQTNERIEPTQCDSIWTSGSGRERRKLALAIASRRCGSQFKNFKTLKNFIKQTIQGINDAN